MKKIIIDLIILILIAVLTCLLLVFFEDYGGYIIGGMLAVSFIIGQERA